MGGFAGFMAGLFGKGIPANKGSNKSDDDKESGIAGAVKSMGESVGSYKRGGKVRKTGMAKVHRGERVLTKKQAKRYAKMTGKKS